MYYRYIKPSRAVSKAALTQKMELLTNQSDTEMHIVKNGKEYKFKFTVEQFASRKQAFNMLNKAKEMPNWQQFFTEV